VQPSYFDEMGGVPSYQIVVQLNEMHGLKHDPLEVAGRKYEIWEEIKSLPALIPATNAILDQNQGIKPISIGTGARRPDAIRTLQDLNLLHKLTHVVTSSDVEKGKPHPDTFLKAAKLMGVDPSKCVVFEDTEIGRQAASAAGMDCILVVNGELVHYPL
jgi:beta-phosphoglucomutase-like phosphatase (HAD superfamily)